MNLVMLWVVLGVFLSWLFLLLYAGVWCLNLVIGLWFMSLSRVCAVGCLDGWTGYGISFESDAFWYGVYAFMVWFCSCLLGHVAENCLFLTYCVGIARVGVAMICRVGWIVYEC